MAKWRASRLKQIKAYNAKYYALHLEKFKAYGVKYRALHSEQLKNNIARWRALCPDKVKAYTIKYRVLHSEQIKASYSRRKLKIRTYRREYSKRRRANDSIFKLADNLRSRVYKILKREKTIKAATTMRLVGCSVADLKVYLESKFKDGMTWKNHGYFGWHVDHIKPLASFDLTDPEQQKIAFHYTNLQPLWAGDNRRKGAKLNWALKNVEHKKA